MEQFRNFHYYLQRVHKEHIEMDHTWTYHFSKLMKVIRIWYDAEDYPKTTFTERTITMAIRALVPVLWVSLFVEYIREAKNIPVSKICEGFSLIVGFCLTNYHITRYASHRDQLTRMIAYVDNKFHEMQKVDTRARRAVLADIRRVYVIQGYFGLFAMSIGALIGTTQSVYALLNGRLYYDSALPFDQTPYSWQWLLQIIYQWVDVVFLGIYFSLKEIVIGGMFFELTFLFKVHSADIRNLCLEPDFDPVVEFRKLRKILREISDLLYIGDELKDFVFTYLFIMFVSVNLILPMAGFAIIIESGEDGLISAIAKSSFYPIYCVMIVLCWALLGEQLTDSFEGVKEAIYDSNWPAFPEDMKRMLVICQIRTQKRNYLEGGSFFIMGMPSVTDRTYYILTLLGDMVK